MQNNYRKASSFFSLKIGWMFCILMALNVISYSQTTMRLYLIGNSVTDAINYNGLKALAESRGNTHIWARQMIPGAPLSWLWEHPNDGFVEQPYGVPTNAFPNYTWDAISLQPFDRMIEGSGNDKEMVGNYINLSKNKSPNAQYYIYMRWPRMPNGKNSLTDCSECTADAYTNTWARSFTGGYDGTNETKDYFEDLLLAVRAANFTSKQPLIVPVGEVFNLLNTRMKNGQVPGYSRIWQVYSDGIHMSGVGSYIAACTYFATVYKADPRGLGVPSDFGTIPSNVATAIQNAVWDVVSTYQYAGVGSSVAVTSVSVSPATFSLSIGQSGQLSVTFNPSNASNKGVAWTSSNTSIATVNSSGQVTGVAAGSATITATTSDGAKTASSTVTVSAASAGSGLSYQYFTGSWDVLPTFSSLTASKTGTVANFDLSPRTQDDNFAFRFTGNISIATAGSYTFYTTSDDGSKLYIDGAQIVNNDGLHGAVEQSGSLNLTAGSHQIEVTMFEKTGGEVLEVRYQGPGISKTLIPSSVLSNGSSIAVTSVSVSPTTASVMIGKTSQLSATVSPSNASNKNITWTSSNNSIATVNASGLVTGVASGTATITANTADGNKTATSAVTVFANGKPTAVLNASATSGNAPLSITFNANGSSDPNAGDFILGYDWNFGDGSPIDYNVSPSHTYATAGTYTVTLKVMDNNNLYSDPVTTTITVSNGTTTPPTGGALASWDFAGKGGQTTVSATSKASDVASASATLASGLTAIDYLGNGLTATNQTSADLAGAIAGNDYLSFTVSPSSGKSLSITQLDFRAISQDFTRTFAVFSSKNGFAAGNVISSFTSSSQFSGPINSVNISGHTNLTTATEFRVYVYGGTNQYQSIGAGNRSGAAGTYDVAIIGTSSGSTNPTGGPSGYSLCSSEGQTCVLSGTQDVAYGANGTFVYKYNQTGSISCSNATFGDPISGVTKSCYVKTSAATTGSVSRETWTGISGTTIAAIPQTTTPNTTATLTSLEIPVDAADNYGTRIRGYIIPSSTGAFTFYVSGDDDVELYLSTNDDPAGRTRIAYINGWTNSREWNRYPSQTSAARNLTAGQKYFFEVLHKEGNGGDNLAIGWTGPGISTISVIGGSNIAPFNGTVNPPPTSDTQAPTVPAELGSSNIAQTSFTLSWNASSDNVGVTSYEIFRGGNSIGTTASTSYNVTGLTAATSYSMTVRAKDAAGNVSAASNTLSVTTSNNTTPPPSGTPKLPIGMNINSTNYYTTGLIFTDVMCAASEMFTFYDGGPWNSEQINNIPRDVNGYPTQLPYNTAGQNQKVRFLINNNYTGRYVVLNDGVGKFTVNGLPSTIINGKVYIDFNGQGGNIWINLEESQSGNHLRNFRIVPEQYANGSAYPTFLSKFLDGLRPFHALRFMDWTSTNGSQQKNWSDRATKTYYSQCTGRGSSIEYAIELANELNTHTWFCVPAMASDDYQKQMARLIRDNLKSTLKVYIEYSNEVWNWQFQQASWVLNNAPGSVDSYVTSDLTAIDPTGSHPEKDAYMMARTFRLFKGEFTGSHAARLIKVAAVQHSWMDNTRRVLEYLKTKNQQCDLVSPAGYFNFEQKQHDLWNTQCSAVTAAQVVAGADAEYAAGSQYWTRETAKYAKQYGVGYAVYEGGQHMQPWMQGDWCYNQAVWDAQIHPAMYDLYMKNFRTHIEPEVNCQLFMAFSYISERKSKYGSWGHLEGLHQIGGVNGNYMTTAPKYQALLDANAAKTTTGRLGAGEDALSNEVNGFAVYPNPAKDEINIAGLTESSTIEIVGFDGRVYIHKDHVLNSAKLPLLGMPAGLYMVRVQNAAIGTVNKKLIIE